MSLGGKNINLEMVVAGFAEVYRGDPAPGQALAPYWKAEERAKAAKRGMWAQGDKYITARGIGGEATTAGETYREVDG